jgi:hypothetical protein
VEQVPADRTNRSGLDLGQVDVRHLLPWLGLLGNLAIGYEDGSEFFSDVLEVST